MMFMNIAKIKAKSFEEMLPTIAAIYSIIELKELSLADLDPWKIT